MNNLELVRDYFNGIAAKLESVLNCSLDPSGYEMGNASNFNLSLGGRQ